MRDILYAPWREKYINDKKTSSCVFCHISRSENEEKQYILHKDKHCFVVMNKYPYTQGHFMIVPHFHTSNIEDLPTETWLHMSALTQKCVRLLKEGLNAQGVNIGMNLGKAGGAGIAEHIHMHFVPRWSGDTNFITSIAQTRVYSSDFETTYNKLKKLIPLFIKE